MFAKTICLILLVCCAAVAQEPSDWIQLFNGKDLTGWTPKIRGSEPGVNFGNTFRVENGVLKVGYEAYDEFKERFGHLFYKDKFSYYIIAAEYRFVGQQAKGGPGWALRNSGIMIHGQDPSTMPKDQDFPISIEVQLLGGDGTNPRTTMNLCTPGTNVVMDSKLITTHCLTAKSKTYHGEQWVRAEALVLGASLIRHKIDGETLIEYTMPQIGGGSGRSRPDQLRLR